MMILHLPDIPAVVLVVEDEMLLRMRAVDMVEEAGFTSVEAVDADQAVAILESRSDIALLFTDIQMPGSMDGLKLAHARCQGHDCADADHDLSRLTTALLHRKRRFPHNHPHAQ